MDAIVGNLRKDAGIALLWLDKVGMAARRRPVGIVGEPDVVEVNGPFALIGGPPRRDGTVGATDGRRDGLRGELFLLGDNKAPNSILL